MVEIITAQTLLLFWKKEKKKVSNTEKDVPGGNDVGGRLHKALWPPVSAPEASPGTFAPLGSSGVDTVLPQPLLGDPAHPQAW